MVKQINHKELQRLMQRAYEKQVPLFIHGTFGIGKSTAVKRFCVDNNLNFLDVRLTQIEPSDLRGLPKLDGETTKWLPPSWLPKNDGSKGILLFDELNLALPSIQASAYQLILDRKLGDYELPDGWVILACGNRTEDKAHVFDLPAPLSNRFIHTELSIPTDDEFVSWGLDNGVDNRIIGFLKFKPTRVYNWTYDTKDKAVATPRSWKFCSDLIKDVEDDKELNILISSAVGESTAIELLAFIKLQRKVDAEAILKNPKLLKEFNNKDVDYKYSVITELAEYYRKNKEAKILNKIVEIAQPDLIEVEFGVLLLRMAKALDNKFFDEELTAKIKAKDKNVNTALETVFKYS